MRKLAKPGIKKVGIIFSGMNPGIQMLVSAVPAHRSMNVQKNLSEILSVITYRNLRVAEKDALPRSLIW